MEARTGLESVPDGAFLREACWHSAGLAFLPQAGRSPRAAAKAAGEAHVYARMATPGTEAGLAAALPGLLSTGAKLKRPTGEGMGTGKVLVGTRHGWRFMAARPLRSGSAETMAEASCSRQSGADGHWLSGGFVTRLRMVANDTFLSFCAS